MGGLCASLHRRSKKKLNEGLLGPIWLTVFGAQISLEFWGVFSWRAKIEPGRNPCSLHRKSKTKLNESLLGPIWLTVFGAQISLEFWGVLSWRAKIEPGRNPWEPLRCLFVKPGRDNSKKECVFFDQKPIRTYFLKLKKKSPLRAAQARLARLRSTRGALFL